MGWWVGMVSSKDILLKYIANDDGYSSAWVGGLCVGIFSSLQGWLCVEVLCALQCAKNSVGACRQSLGCLNVCRMSFRVTYNVEALVMWRHSVFRPPSATADYRYKSSLFILLIGVIRLPKLKLISEQKDENFFVAPPYCQCTCYGQLFRYLHNL